MTKFGSARVDDELKRITSKNSDLIKRARKRGQNSSGQRGLLNSSIAAETGEAAVLDVAVPIASQNAQQTHQKNLSHQNFIQQKDISRQNFNQQKDLNTQQHGFNLETQQNDLTNRRDLAVLDSNTRLEINQNTLDAQERAEGGRQLLEADRIYQNTLVSLSQNPDLPPEERQRLQANALTIRNRSQDVIRNIYSVPLKWDNTTSTTAPPPPPVIPATPPKINVRESVNRLGLFR